MIYFFTERGQGAYVEADDNDPIYDPATCLLVTKKPLGMGYIYNLQSSKWELTTPSQQAYIRPIRNRELARTDKYVLVDYPLTPEELVTTKTYRQELREVPDKPTPQEMVMPPCPPFLNPIP